jgi:hypothetical protein
VEVATQTALAERVAHHENNEKMIVKDGVRGVLLPRLLVVLKAAAQSFGEGPEGILLKTLDLGHDMEQVHQGGK